MESQELTNCSDDLCFNTELVGESTGEIRDASPSVSGDIWDFSNMVVHVSTGEHEDRNQAQYRPYVSILQHRKDVWICHSGKGEDTDHDGYGRDQLRPVEGSRQGGIATRWKMPLYPCVDAFSRLGCGKVISYWLS